MIVFICHSVYPLNRFYSSWTLQTVKNEQTAPSSVITNSLHKLRTPDIEFSGYRLLRLSTLRLSYPTTRTLTRGNRWLDGQFTEKKNLLNQPNWLTRVTNGICCRFNTMHNWVNYFTASERRHSIHSIKYNVQLTTCAVGPPQPPICLTQQTFFFSVDIPMFIPLRFSQFDEVKFSQVNVRLM